MGLISQNALQRFVIAYPIQHVDFGIFCRRIADDYSVNAGVDNHTLAHGAGTCIRNQFPGVYIPPYQIKSSTDHVIAGSGNNCILLGVNRTAKLITLSPRNFQFFTGAISQIGTIFPSPRSPDLSGGDDLVIFDDNSAEITPQTGSALQYRFGNIQIIVCFISAFHCNDHSLHIPKFTLPYRHYFNKSRVVSVAEILFKHKPISQRSEQCFNKSRTATSSGFYYNRKGTGLQEGRFCQRENQILSVQCCFIFGCCQYISIPATANLPYGHFAAPLMVSLIRHKNPTFYMHSSSYKIELPIWE